MQKDEFKAVQYLIGLSSNHQYAPSSFIALPSSFSSFPHKGTETEERSEGGMQKDEFKAVQYFSAHPAFVSTPVHHSSLCLLLSLL